MSEYSRIEERVNVYTHFFGVLLAVIALTLLVAKSLDHHSYDLQSQVSFVIFGLSLTTLYVASTLYHNTNEPQLRFRRKILDHSAIYVLIAGTYSPYALAALQGAMGWWIFGVSWLMACIGITLKVFFTGRFKVVSTLMYILMGWMIVLFIKPLMTAISAEGFYWLLAGGVSYSVGALIYLIKAIKFNHGIFHVFVLLGSLCHFISVYFYI